MRILAMDIGANNVKAVALEQLGTHVALRSVQTRCHEAAALPDDVEYCSQYLSQQRPWDAVVVVNSVTGYGQTHRQGLERLNQLLDRAFPGETVFHLTASGELVRPSESGKRNIYEFMGTNFYGSAALGAGAIEHGLTVDVGTSSTDIIPVVDGRPQPLALARTDYNRFLTAELHMWGLLYSPIESLCSTVPFRGGRCPVVPAMAKTGHAHALLGWVDAEVLAKDFQTTWSFKDARERMARMLYLDPELVSGEEVREIARHVHHVQVTQTAEAIAAVARRAGIDLAVHPIAAMGLGKDAIVAEAASLLGAQVVDPAKALPSTRRNVLSAVGVALAGFERLTGQRLALSQLTAAPDAAGVRPA